jgi:putative ABC transport system substrate-binding protein
MEFGRLKRREFIKVLGGAAAAWPLAARAQESGRTYRLGFLVPSPKDSQSMAAFFDELRREGFIEQQNLEILPGGFDTASEKLAELAGVLAKAMPDAIVAGPALPLRALQAATQTVPLIGLSEDLVAEGLVASLARPGGNITGISLLAPELDGKRQDILIEAIAGARRIAALYDARATPPFHLLTLEHAARSRGVALSTFGVNGPEDVRAAIDGAKESGAEGLNFLASSLFGAPGSRSYQIVMERSAAIRLPANPWRSGDAHARPHRRSHLLRGEFERQVAVSHRRPHAPFDLDR